MRPLIRLFVFIIVIAMLVSASSCLSPFLVLRKAESKSEANAVGSSNAQMSVKTIKPGVLTVGTNPDLEPLSYYCLLYTSIALNVRAMIVPCPLLGLAGFGLFLGKEYVVRHHVEGGALVAVPIGVLACLDRTLHRDELALAEIPADKLSRAPPCDNVNEIGLFFLSLWLVGTVHRDAEAAHRYPRLCACLLYTSRCV